MSKPEKNGEKKSILIVEDSVDFSNLMKFVVEDEGFEGIQFPLDNEDIVSWTKEHRPAAILMDLALRRKGGREFIDDLKADPATKSIPIVVITGRELSYKEILEFEMRNVKYLRKGRVEMDEIKRVIREAAGGRKHTPAVRKAKEH
jgi:CheY-like chemotaxis protein